MDLICFDLDNTLLNSERAHVYAYNYALKKNGYKPWKFKDLVVLFGKPHEKVISIITRSKNNKIIQNIIEDHDKILIKRFNKYARVKKGVKKTLYELRKKYFLGVVSNASHKSIAALLEGASLDKNYFSIVVGNDDVKHSKPYPDEILKAQKLVHHKAKVMIGDSIYDVLAGKKAKIRTIAILSGRYTKKQLKKVKADYIIKNFKDILKIL